MQTIRNYECVFGRNLYDSDETNTILEIRLTLYWPILGEIKSSFLRVADFFKSSCSYTSHFDVGSHSVFFAVQINEQKYYDAHCKVVHWSGHRITHKRLWSSMMMLYIRTKEAEENLSLHQYNFLAGSRKTVPLACRSEDWIEIPKQSSRRLLPVVKATVRIFSSRTDLPQSFSFHTAC